MTRSTFLRRARRGSTTMASAVLGMLSVVMSGCTPPVTDDLVGPDAPLLPVEVTTAVDTTMWGTLADCVARDHPGGTAPRPSEAPEAIAGVTAFTEEPGEEVEDCGRHGVSPPVGGDWNALTANCGFYPSPVPVPLAVTALRRGAVWVVFRPDVSEDDLRVIREATIRSEFILASPQAGLEMPLVMTAWERQLPLDSTSDPRFDEFIDTYTNSYRVPDIDGHCGYGMGEPQDRYR